MRVRILLLFFGIMGLNVKGERGDVDWLARFQTQLEPGSELAKEIAELGSSPSRELIITTAANYFRSRPPLVPLWVVPLDRTASAEDVARSDLAIDHVITERSGVFEMPDKLPWFDAPKKFATLSRFPHFDYLLPAYTTSGDERYARAVVRDTLDFVSHVDLADSVNFHVQIDANLNPWNWVLLQWRVKRWIDMLAHLRESPSLSDEDYLRILQYTWDEVDWLVPNKILGLHNGTLGNAGTILYAALQYPDAKNAAFWQSDATALLEGFLDTAFYPREFLIELTLGYSEGTLLMCRKMYESLPPSPAKDRITPKLEAIFDAHVGMMKPDRGIPRYGDHGIYDIRDRILRKGAELFDRPDLARLADEPDARERSDGRLSFPYESNPYYLSGYYAMRDGWHEDAQYLSMDAGPFGTNHQHGDKLSITVSADGAPFIVDPGTSLYTSAEPGPRHDLRLGFLHNVITVNGIDPNTGWDRHYAFDVLENRWVTNSVYDFLEGTYEFRNNLLDAMWRRSVFYVKGDYWVILDALYGEGEHEVESNLQFWVGNKVNLAHANRATATAPNGASLDVLQVLGHGLESEVLMGDDHFPETTFLRQYPTFVDWQLGGRGWVGTFGNNTPLPPVKNYPAPALLQSGKVKFPFKTVTVLTPSIDQTVRQAEVKVLEESEHRFVLEITTPEGQRDTLRWELADWPDHDTKIADDSGWWVREESGGIKRVIIMNRESVTATVGTETVSLKFDGAFEGHLDRTTEGWSITPDAYNAVTPKLTKFVHQLDGQVMTYQSSSKQPLASNTSHELVPLP
ncbi:MAG: hypothetical protein SynsKO_29300 [Synoicihabitans sp.]